MNRGELETLLDGLRSRGEIKAFGARLDREPDLRAQVLALARFRGLSVDEGLSGKALVRRVRDRQSQARVRGNPIHRDTAFRCQHCGRLVEPGGARVRDHCPFCLRGLHVDRVPGDRASDCGGILDPVRFELSGRAGVVIHYRCRRCGAAWRGRAHPDDAIPPDFDVTAIDTPASPQASGTGAVDRARTLPDRVLEAIRRGGLWSPGDTVLVAVSGGLDSTVLLELLARTAGAHGGRLVVASLDHGLRPESVAEVAGVGRLARTLGLPFHGRRLELQGGSNLQARARQARRAALLDLALGEGPGVRIATAHHANDQAETVLYHLLRGSGSTGLRGMQPLDPPWCKPLLSEPREVLLAWAQVQGLRWVEDPSNPRSQRGAIRRLLPELDALHGGAVGALGRSARLLAREDALLDALAEQADVERDGGVDVAALRALHPALQLRVLRRLARPCPGVVRADQLEAFLTWEPRNGGRLPLPAGWSLVMRGGVLWAEPHRG